MLTFRRGALVATVVLILFVLFGGAGRVDTGLFHDKDLEQRLVQSERNLEAMIKELQKNTDSHAEKQDKELRKMRTEKRILEKQIQQLRRLPETAGVRQQLHYQYPYNRREKFPAYVWQTYKYNFDDQEIDRTIHDLMETWRQRNAGFVHEVMSDKLSALVIRHLYMNVPQVVEAYLSMPEPILKADFFRYLILFARGGVYTDADTECLKPIPVWIPSNIPTSSVGLVVGIEADPDRPDWAEWYARRIQFCQWTIQAKPGHPALGDIVANITEQTLQRKKDGTLALAMDNQRGSNIMDWTGPGIWTDSVFEHLQNFATSGQAIGWEKFTNLKAPVRVGDVAILPITSFSPGVNQMGAQSETDPLAFVKHHFEGSWKNDEKVI